MEPHLYYIPPIHADRTYLQLMFGPNVDEAIEKYRALKDDPVAQGLLVLMGGTDRIMHKFEVNSGTARGFDEKGDELLSVPVTEPLVVRDAFNEEHKAIRQNTP